jgi:hypothetical protein
MTYKELFSFLQQLSTEELDFSVKIFVPNVFDEESGKEYKGTFYSLNIDTQYDEDAKTSYPYFILSE